MIAKPKGRPKKYTEYETLYNSLPKNMKKRPKYVNNIGVFKGSKSETAWVKIQLPNGGVYNGKSYKSGQYIEVKVGKLSSWGWEQLKAKRNELQGR